MSVTPPAVKPVSCDVPPEIDPNYQHLSPFSPPHALPPVIKTPYSPLDLGPPMSRLPVKRRRHDALEQPRLMRPLPFRPAAPTYTSRKRKRDAEDVTNPVAQDHHPHTYVPLVAGPAHVRARAPSGPARVIAPDAHDRVPDHAPGPSRLLPPVPARRASRTQSPYPHVPQFGPPFGYPQLYPSYPPHDIHAAHGGQLWRPEPYLMQGYYGMCSGWQGQEPDVQNGYYQ